MLTLVLTLLCADVDAQAASLEALPLPPALQAQVDFWKRIYSEVDSSHGLVHDSRQMNVVYETLAMPPALSYRAQRRLMKASTRRISDILHRLSRGKRDDLSEDEARVLAAWPADVTNATLARAALNVRYQSGQRDRFMAGLLRARPWMPYIERTFAQHGLPRELAALPHVESSFDMRAYSKAHAAGIFQFTAATGRQFMRMDAAVDERYDPVRATESAARLLSQNYQRIGSWPLAITAYNHGTEGMRRAVARTKTSDIVEIIANYRNRRFGFASRNFYTELLAAWEVSSNAERYFGKLPLDAQSGTQYASLTTDSYLRIGSVARALGVDVDVLRAHNPALRPAVWNSTLLVPRGFTFRVPQSAAADEATYLARLASIPSAERFESAGRPQLGALVARASLHSGPTRAVAQASRRRTARPVVRAAPAVPTLQSVWDPSAVSMPQD